MLLDFLLPSPCLHCSKVGAAICSECVAELNLHAEQFELNGLPAFSFAEYGEVSAVVNAIKEKGLTSLIPALVNEMARSWPELFQSCSLVPIPSSPANAKKRGFSHTSAFARGLARELASVSVSELLVSGRPRLDQSALNLAERRQNMVDAFRVVGRGRDKPLVLFDDVCTSGASLTEAARCLELAGFTVIGFCVFARVLAPKSLN